MADSGRQSPLGVNVLGSLLENNGFTINNVASGYMGESKTNTDYTFGTVVNNTVLRLLTWAINDAYVRGYPNGGTTVSVATYNNLISIGSTSIPAFGNSKPASYLPIDSQGIWARTSLSSTTPALSETYGIQQGYAATLPGPATAGYPIGGLTGQGQEATWYPYTGDSTLNSNTGITQWGWIRCHALQAWNEFNYNGTSANQANADYKEFVSSLMSTSSYLVDSNHTLHVLDNSETFLEDVYSNMNDLITASIAGLSLSTLNLGTDLENLGKAINLRQVETLGMPSNLLINIGKAGAISPDLALALLAAGIDKNVISSISNGVVPNWSKELEQQIFGAFLIITGENLTNILASLNCKTQGLETLADLLNIRKMFPLSYETLTVPIYNSTLGLPTNSKTYYLIYDAGSVNPALSSQSIREYVGTIIPSGLPPIYSETEGYSELPIGFGSYHDGILPDDWAIANGALSYSLRQITNIENVNFETFAKVVKSIETVTDLPLVAGTNKPTNQSMIDISASLCANGSGKAGTYTMSDFFGCMTGLPYPWRLIQRRLTDLSTSTLVNIYKQLYLAVSWEQATATVNSTQISPGVWTVNSITITNSGGGYGREGASAPTVNIGGTIVTATIGTDDTDAGSNGLGNFGRVVSIPVPGGTFASAPSASIAAPPGGGWPTMNTTIQTYIDAANNEIANILANRPTDASYLNTYWEILGNQLAREQRSRYHALGPVSVPKDYFATPYPNTLYIFVDSLASLAQDTRPHMSAQTLEAISDLNTLGGQSVVAKMREERNQARLRKLGIDLDNNIPDTMNDTDVKTVTTNGTIAGAIEGPSCVDGNIYTLPAWMQNEQDGIEITPVPNGYYVPNNGFKQTENVTDGDIISILECDPNPSSSILVASGPVIEQPQLNVVIMSAPDEFNITNLSPNLDINYTSSTLLPSTLDVKRAIDNVITCNCDCWM